MAPICNMPAYEAVQRSSPIDGLNLARVFPGDDAGSITRQIASWLTRKLLRHADFLINLHTGGIAYELPTLTVAGRVRALSDGAFDCELPDNHFASFYGDRVQMGRCVWLRVAGVNILLTERKTPPLDLAQLRHIGIQPERQRMIVVKSAVAWRAAYLPIAAAVIEMDTAGLCSANLSRFPYRHLKRPVYPLD